MARFLRHRPLCQSLRATRVFLYHTSAPPALTLSIARLPVVSKRSITGTEMASPQNAHKTFPIATIDRKTGKPVEKVYHIPAVGLGTWQSGKGGETARAVEAALKAGYRYIDTALAYGNENEVGEGIRASGVPRSEIWVTTKLDNPWHACVNEGIDTSLKNLGLDYVDLYLMHWPCSTDPGDLSKHLPDWDFIKTWKSMQQLMDPRNPRYGKARNIGVSNFGITNLKKLLDDPEVTIKPAVNQYELHPNNPSKKLVAYCKELGIHLTGYSCLGSTNSPLYKDKVLLKIADDKGKTPQQCLLQWGIQNGWDVIPKSVSKDRIEANFALDGWELTHEELEKLSNLPDRFKVCGDTWLPDVMHGKVFDGKDE